MPTTATTAEIHLTRIRTAIFNGDENFAVDVEFVLKDKGLRIAHFANDLVGDLREPRLTGVQRFVKHVYIAEPPVFAVVSCTDTDGNRLPLTSFAIHDVLYQLTHKYANNDAYFKTIDGETDEEIELD